MSAPPRSQKIKIGSLAKIAKNDSAANPPKLHHSMDLNSNNSIRRPPHKFDKNNSKKSFQVNINKPPVSNNSLLPKNKVTTQWKILPVVLQHHEPTHHPPIHQSKNRSQVAQQISHQTYEFYRFLLEIE